MPVGAFRGAFIMRTHTRISSEPKRWSSLTNQLSPLLRYHLVHKRAHTKCHNMSNLEGFLQSLIGASRGATAPQNASPRRAFAWARVSTGQQEERGLSMPEQLREIHRYAEANGIEIVAEFQEAASAYRHQSRRHEFHRMIERAQMIRASP